MQENQLQMAAIASLIIPRKSAANKGDYGHALLISGQKGKMGAAVLASQACLRSGVGLLSVCSPESCSDILQISVPEAMVFNHDFEEIANNTELLKKFKTIGVGPGIGTSSEIQRQFLKLLENYHQPCVLDADALNCLSMNKEYFSRIPGHSILTPHAIEFKRLVGDWSTDDECLGLQSTFSQQFNCFLVLKGAGTRISCPNGKVYLNTTGNPGMAKAGSGDVLTGMITAFLSQGYSSEDAVRIAVFTHGLAGDLAKEEKTEFGVLASDIIQKIPAALKVILESKKHL